MSLFAVVVYKNPSNQISRHKRSFNVSRSLRGGDDNDDDVDNNDDDDDDDMYIYICIIKRLYEALIL